MIIEREAVGDRKGHCDFCAVVALILNGHFNHLPGAADGSD